MENGLCISYHPLSSRCRVRLPRTTISQIAIQSHKLVHVEIDTILDRNELFKRATVLFFAKTHFHVNNPQCCCRVISTKPAWYIGVTVVLRNAGCCHLSFSIFTESVPGFFFENVVIITLQGTGRFEYKRCFPIGLIKQTVVVTWICLLKIETKNNNDLLVCTI